MDDKTDEADLGVQSWKPALGHGASLLSRYYCNLMDRMYTDGWEFVYAERGVEKILRATKGGLILTSTKMMLSHAVGEIYNTIYGRDKNVTTVITI